MQVVRALVDATNINTKDNNNQTALTWACKQGHTAIVGLLLEHDAKPSELDLIAASHHFPILELLLFPENSDRVDPVEYLTQRVVVHAAIGYTDMLEVLLAAGANSNSSTLQHTALTQAIEEKHIDGVRLLLNAKADPNLYVARGKAPLVQLICSKLRPDLYYRWELIDLLLTSKADPNLVNPGDKGKTPLHYACEKHYEHSVTGPHMVKLLITAGAHIDVEDSNGHTALNYADTYDEIKAEEYPNMRKEVRKTVYDQLVADGFCWTGLPKIICRRIVVAYLA